MKQCSACGELQENDEQRCVSCGEPLTKLDKLTHTEEYAERLRMVEEKYSRPKGRVDITDWVPSLLALIGLLFGLVANIPFGIIACLCGLYMACKAHTQQKKTALVVGMALSSLITVTLIVIWIYLSMTA